MTWEYFSRMRMGLVLSLFFVFLSAHFCSAHIIQMQSGEAITFSEMIDDLQKSKIVFIGEKHDNLHHHLAQLQVVKGLEAAGAKIAIGLEMFRSDSQQALDDWVTGKMIYQDFLKIYFDNWTLWEKYADIYLYARQKNIPLIGLNISREITQKVAQQGLSGFSGEQLQDLPIVQCKVDQPYMDFIRRALGGHNLEGTQFRYFCEAQMLWDKVMAINVHEYMVKNPDTIVVVLAGSGHSWKYGIPAQLSEMGAVPYRVLLPDIPGRLTVDEASQRDTDYLMLGVDEAPLH
jgi:uncharacterized iron-regulated protein